MTQRVILIHGPPACGKLTTAIALKARIGGVVLHNHLTYNLARILFEIDDPRLVALHRELRLVMLRYALAEDMPDLILTLVYAEPDPGDTVAEVVALIERHGAELVPVYLECPEAELLVRVAAEGREASGKLTSTERLRTLLARHRHPPLPHPGTRIIANGQKSAQHVAREIEALLEPAPGS